MSRAATAVQHVCLAKALMLIREYEVYDYTIEQRTNLKVRNSATPNIFQPNNAHLLTISCRNKFQRT